MTSQPDDPIADYGYFDIWPNNKNIRLGIGSNRIYQLIDELSIDVLLLPFVEDEKTVVSRHDNVARVNKKEGLGIARNIFLCGRFRPCNANVEYFLRATAYIFW